VLLAGTAPLTVQRPWLDRLAILVPAPAATRWLLIADVACLVALGLATGRPRLGVPFMLGAGFIALNGLGMAVTDFYLGLALFHLVVGIAVVLLARRARWLGLATLALTLGLGVLT
jgi:hypothetical protein